MPIRLIYSAAVGLGAFLAVLSTFLPWASMRVALPIIGEIGSITRYGYEGDGIIVLLLGLMAGGVAAYVWLERGVVAYRLSTLFNAFLGALIFVIALINLVDSQRAVGGAQSKLGLDPQQLLGLELEQFLGVDTGAGVYVTIAAGAIITAAALLAFAAQRVEPFASLLGIVEAACPRCRVSLPDGAQFCPACGHRVT